MKARHALTFKAQSEPWSGQRGFPRRESHSTEPAINYLEGNTLWEHIRAIKLQRRARWVTRYATEVAKEIGCRGL